MMKKLIDCLNTNGFKRLPFGVGFYYQKNSIDLVDNTHLLNGGYLTPLIRIKNEFTEEMQFENVKTVEQLNAVILKAQKLHKGSLDEIQLVDIKLFTISV